MIRILAITIAIVLGTATAFAGKEPKWSEFQQTYSSVSSQIRNDPAKMAKARAIRASVKNALDSMDRTAFYSYVAQKEAELLGLTK